MCTHKNTRQRGICRVYLVGTKQRRLCRVLRAKTHDKERARQRLQDRTEIGQVPCQIELSQTRAPPPPLAVHVATGPIPSHRTVRRRLQPSTRAPPPPLHPPPPPPDARSRPRSTTAGPTATARASGGRASGRCPPPANRCQPLLPAQFPAAHSHPLRLLCSEGRAEGVPPRSNSIASERRANFLAADDGSCRPSPPDAPSTTGQQA